MLSRDFVIFQIVSCELQCKGQRTAGMFIARSNDYCGTLRRQQRSTGRVCDVFRAWRYRGWTTRLNGQRKNFPLWRPSWCSRSLKGGSKRYQKTWRSVSLSLRGIIIPKHANFRENKSVIVIDCRG